MMNPMTESNSHRRGAALFLAITMLSLFSLLGAIYIKSMEIRLEKANYEMRKARVSAVAGGAVRAAVAELKAAAAAGNVDALIGQVKTYDVPAYDVRTVDKDGVSDFAVEANANRISRAEVTISTAASSGDLPCYQIVSEGLYASSAGDETRTYNRVSTRIEAIVALRADGGCDIIQWHQQGRRPAEPSAEAASPAA